MGQGSVDVEPVEGPGRASAQDPPATAARRAGLARLLRRWWPVPVALVLGLVAWQVVADRQDRAAVAELRGTPGVIGSTVTPPLTATPWGTSDALAVLAEPVETEDGLLLGSVLARTGGWDVVALDADDGTEVWRAAVTQPEPRAGTSAFVVCEGDADPARDVACLVQTERYDPGPGEAAVASRLVRVDLAGRTVEPVRDLPPGAAAAVAGDLLVLAENRPGAAGGPGVIALAATDLATGEPRWQAEVPGAFPVGAGVPAVRWLDGHVLVHGPAQTWALDPADGAVQGSGTDLQVLRGGRLADVAGSSATRLFGPDGEPRVSLEGTSVVIAPDDGGVPDLLVLRRYDGSAGGTLQGVDAGTGTPLWDVTLDRDPMTPAVLLGGLLYVSDGPTVRAVDAATGEQRWATTGGTENGAGLVSDGVHLLRVERDPAAGGQVLAAYALADGSRTWSTPMPEQVDTLLVRDGQLYGRHDSELLRIG